MKLQGMTNVECRLTNGGIASLNLFQIGRIHYSMFNVGRSMFDVHYFDIHYSLFDIRYSHFESFFPDLTGRLRPEAALV